MGRRLGRAEVVRVWEETGSLTVAARRLGLTRPGMRSALIRAGIRPPTAPHSPDPTLVTCVDAALILGVSDASVYQHIQRGDLTAHRHPAYGGVLLDPDQVRKLARLPRPAGPQPPDGLISVAQAAEKAGRSANLIRGWITRGQLNAEQREGRWWIDPADLAERLERLPQAHHHALNTPPEPGLISTSEASRRAGRSVEVIRGWIDQGRLPAQRHHGRWWLTPENVEAAARDAPSPHSRPRRARPAQRPPGMLTPAEAARRLAVQPRTVHRAILANRLPASRDMRTGHYWIPKTAVEALIPEGVNPAECLNATQASQFLGISRRRLRHLTRTGTIPAVYFLTPHPRYNPDALHTYLPRPTAKVSKAGPTRHRHPASAFTNG